MSGAGVSFRNPTPVLIASLSVITGSIKVDAFSIMSIYYGEVGCATGVVWAESDAA
jgi:hypothetical protein